MPRNGNSGEEYGRLREVAHRLTDKDRWQCVVFAGSYAIASEGITLLGTNGSALIVREMARGMSPSSRLALAAKVQLRVVRVDGLKPVRDARFSAAMTRAEFRRAFDTGSRAARRAAGDVLAVGEIGAGNTTAAAAALALLARVDPRGVVGRGSGISLDAYRKKKRVVSEMVRKHAPARAKGMEILRLVGGKEMVALSGAIAWAAGKGAVVVLDGMITAVAALALAHDRPQVRASLFASHRSTEPAHGLALDMLRLRPMMDLELACGQAYGALAMLGLGRLALKSFPSAHPPSAGAQERRDGSASKASEGQLSRE